MIACYSSTKFSCLYLDGRAEAPALKISKQPVLSHRQHKACSQLPTQPACMIAMVLQDGAHGHQRQRQVQLPPDILQQGGVAPDLAEPESASFASGSGDAILLTSTGDDDLIDAQATMHLPSTGTHSLPVFPWHCFLWIQRFPWATLGVTASSVC